MSSATSFYDFKPLKHDGEPFPLSKFKGKVVLVVNTASECGFTYQLDSLQTLKDQVEAAEPGKFEVLGFPCNQFGGQEPGSNEKIQEFCTKRPAPVKYTVLGKVEVNGNNVEPVYEWMKKEKPGLLGMQRIKWNFEKFLIGKDGQVKARWASTTKPESIKGEIMKAINA